MKWIFADVDGTIINRESLIQNDLKDDISAAQSMGYENYNNNRKYNVIQNAMIIKWIEY